MKITKGTIIRTAAFALAWINQLLQMAGHPILDIDSVQLSNFITVVFTLSASVVCFWKNQSFTTSALLGDKAMKANKAVTFLQDMGMINAEQACSVNTVLDVAEKSGIIADIKEDCMGKGTTVEKIKEIAKDVVKDVASTVTTTTTSTSTTEAPVISTVVESTAPVTAEVVESAPVALTETTVTPEVTTTAV
jgi:SPP1 family holin